MQLFDRQRGRISRYLQGRVPPSLIDRGIEDALAGKVLECSRVSDTIQGVVADGAQDSTSYSVQLALTEPAEVAPKCNCDVPDDEWCEHAVSLIWRASELGFLDSPERLIPERGMLAPRGRTSEDLASALIDVGRFAKLGSSERIFTPNVTILLDLSGDRVGIQVLFDGAVQSPSLVREPSTRALDNLLLALLDEHGTWDEQRQLWYASASSDVEALLGFAQEYDSVRSIDTGRPIAFAREPLSVQVQLRWLDQGAELALFWVMSDGSTVLKEGDLIGSGPYWAFVHETLYRVSSAGSRLAALFTHGGVLAVPRTGVGPLLEALHLLGQDSGASSEGELLKVLNPELQPRSSVSTPTPHIEFERRQTGSEQFIGTQAFEVMARLDFEYPLSSDLSEVYLPNRSYEAECVETLRRIGFEPLDTTERRFRITGDKALDLFHGGVKTFPSDWQLNGFDAASKGIRFASLGLSVSLTSPSERSSAFDRGPINDTKVGKIDWFDCHVALQQNNANVPLSTLFRNVRSDEDRWVRLDSGAYAQVPGGGIRNLKTTLGLLDPNFRLSNTIKSKLTPAQALSFSSMQDPNISLSTDSRLKTLVRKFNDFGSIEPIKPSKKFEGKLRSYQEEGMSWMNFLNEFEFGGILADEMGLGKTVQTLALLQKLRSKRTRSKAERLPAMVVAPTSVMMNWFYEAKKFTPDLKVLVLHGPGRKARFSSISEYDLIITSYALLRLDRMELERQSFGYLILDEAQNIKNPDAAVTKAAKSLRAYRRLALTGTPTENRPMELWSIIDFLMPGYLGSSEFFKNFIEKPILEGGPGQEVTGFLRAKTRPFILRRTKAEVEKELPPKIESVIHVEMTNSQKRLYNQILEEVRPKVLASVDKVGIRGASISILAALLRLRQVCNHPNSIDSLKHAPGYDSGKFNALKELITDALDSGGKILLFAQFREMLAIIRRWMDESGTPYTYLDGETRNRQDVVDRFNSDESVKVFLISLKAGGTGLNLASANTVIIYDPWWNPAVESQAVDRAHRIGQRRAVNVYRMVTDESIEQKIMDLKAKKAKMVDALVNENALSPRALSRTDLEQLLSPLPIDGV